ncbi:hydrolase [Candidatus Endobugula sertula]|uniref:Hydrolase n=1 Tax=Candidatus Endobugula sertula TaxID=62101 RepID=A0A1D2QSI7_9GAMM|nr:hydrolase [Candidatus Endobugula sertula]
MIGKQTHQNNKIVDEEITIPINNIRLEGHLHIPEKAKGLVIFAHGSGSSRHSSRNRYVAEVLNKRQLGTVLIDLLSAQEEEVDLQTHHLRFDIPLLASRLVGIVNWVTDQDTTKHFNIGYFGSSTGAGAALIAAAKKAEPITAIVSRGGRPDLAGKFLTQVKAPTLLLVGEYDPQVIELNQQALAHLNLQSQLNVIPRATHLFEEPGTLERVAHLAVEWFEQFIET